MNAKRSYHPVVQQVEDRVVLSFSWSNLVHTLFPLFDSSSSHTAKHVAHPAPAAHHNASRPHEIHALKHKVKA